MAGRDRAEIRLGVDFVLLVSSPFFFFLALAGVLWDGLWRVIVMRIDCTITLYDGTDGGAEGGAFSRATVCSPVIYPFSYRQKEHVRKA